MKIKQVLVILILGILLALTACGAGADPLDGTAWRLDSLDGQPLIAGSAITASFAEDGISGTAGCNSYGGGYKVSGSTITVDSVFSTLMACMDNDVMAQEQTFLALLGEAQTFSVTDTQLTLTTDSGQSLVFSKQ